MANIPTAAVDFDAFLAEFRSLRVAKMNGSGNDFVVIDNRDYAVPEPFLGELSRRICRRGLSIGADGAVFIEESPGGDRNKSDVFDFRWRYFNADGSEGEMCGNGAMCGARFALENQIAGPEMKFETISGPVSARVDLATHMVHLRVPDTGSVEGAVSVDVECTFLRLHAIEVGVPHAVIVVENADQFATPDDFTRIGRAIRNHANFAPRRTNVDVISMTSDNRLRMRTYERGVEAETLACGTGAIASAIVATSLGLLRPPVEVLTSSGETLLVDFIWDGERGRSVFSGGQTRTVMTGVLLPDALIS